MTSSLIVLGSTGSIGTQTLAVIQGLKKAPEFLVLAAGHNGTLLREQIKTVLPDAVYLQDAHQAHQIRHEGFEGNIFCQNDGIIELLDYSVSEALKRNGALPTVIVGISGIAGLAPTLHALKLGCRVLTANKETFVAGGILVKPYLDKIVPLDSEHSAIMQCMQGYAPHHISGLTLTASGGPFLTWSPSELHTVTPAQALKHPKWSMGAKISVDSATLMNKGLEVIEAHWLFGLPYHAIDVAIHPQSVVHGAITFTDGSMLAHLGPTDMRIAIQYGLLLPDRGAQPQGVRSLRLAELGMLAFHPPDTAQFPCLALAIEAGRLGQAATIVLNAADEVLVKRFLNGDIGFLDITKGVEKALDSCRSLPNQTSTISSLDEVFALDAWTRALTGNLIFKNPSYSV
ncbi:MAG: 1-deoxy-D-xylulose-5-phosphate reductoisomerase [Vampirovibrionales bacterium]|nr:1-deoxy-D-xylulose-5-phosphate reductoisomerase [Vampirovibrionales bacterium]